MMLSSIRECREKLKIAGSKGGFYGCAIWFWATVITTLILIAFYVIIHGDEIWILLTIGAAMWGIYFLVHCPVNS